MLVKTGNNAIVQVKGNQKMLLKNLKKAVSKMQPNDKYEQRGKKIRNRIENRKTEIFAKPQKYFDQEIKREWGNYTNTIIKVERERKEFITKTKEWKTSFEISYYISTIKINLKKQKNLTAKEYAAAIRNHWGIENRNHCVKDVSMGEDMSRIRINPDRFAKLRSFGLNIMRINKVENIRNERYKNSLDFDRLFKYNGVFS